MTRDAPRLTVVWLPTTTLRRCGSLVSHVRARGWSLIAVRDTVYRCTG